MLHNFNTAMIKNFEQFNESQNNDFKITDLFSSLMRNYESKKMFYTDLLQFAVEEERRDWGDTRQKVNLEKPKTDDAFYKLIFHLDEKKYLLEINFKITYNGKKEKDAPETASEADLERLNVVLENVQIIKIHIKATDVDYTSSSPDKAVYESCKKFLVKMLSVDYDTLGEELFSFQH